MGGGCDQQRLMICKSKLENGTNLWKAEKDLLEIEIKLAEHESKTDVFSEINSLEHKLRILKLEIKLLDCNVRSNNINQKYTDSEKVQDQHDKKKAEMEDLIKKIKTKKMKYVAEIKKKKKKKKKIGGKKKKKKKKKKKS